VHPGRLELFEMIIREAVAGDYENLNTLINEVDRLHRDNLPQKFQVSEGPVRDRNFILDLIADESVGLFVAEREAQLVGLVHIMIKDTPDIPILVPRRYAVIDNLVVKGGLRRSGIGRALMTKAHDWAITKGTKLVELNVYDFNEAALAFYERLGYKTYSRQMSKSLRFDG
jgi:ribosomal protein S18 acetylase RimI-like enzyme